MQRSFEATTGDACGSTRSPPCSFMTRSVRSAPTDAVDFAARHFRPEKAVKSRCDPAELVASSKAIAKYVLVLGRGRGETNASVRVARAGCHCGSLLRQEPDSVDGWTNLGVIELFRELPREPVARFRAQFDPIYDLSIVREPLTHFAGALALAHDPFRRGQHPESGV